MLEVLGEFLLGDEVELGERLLVDDGLADAPEDLEHPVGVDDDDFPATDCLPACDLPGGALDELDQFVAELVEVGEVHHVLVPLAAHHQ